MITPGTQTHNESTKNTLLILFIYYIDELNTTVDNIICYACFRAAHHIVKMHIHCMCPYMLCLHSSSHHLLQQALAWSYIHYNTSIYHIHVTHVKIR